MGVAGVDWLQRGTDGLSIAAAQSPSAQACPKRIGATDRTRRVEIFEGSIRQTTDGYAGCQCGSTSRLVSTKKSLPRKCNSLSIVLFPGGCRAFKRLSRRGE